MSFPHRDFSNPDAKTCWLSCLFQALWHSVVFHAVFEKDLVAEKYEPALDEALLTALQQTWGQYKADDCNDMQEEVAEAEVQSGGTQHADPKPQSIVGALVPADGLVGGFGEGYGDMSEALACLQSELSDSTNLAAIALSDRMVLLPLLATEGVLPSPAMAWKQALEWQVNTAALISVDITVPQLTRENIESLVGLWLPTHGASTDQENALPDILNTPSDASEKGSLGSSHKMVALVCYMFHLQHYVAFCQRQSNPARCCFFNDLPELTNGVPKEVDWAQVPQICGQYSLTPRLVLYESAETVGEMMQ